MPVSAKASLRLLALCLLLCSAASVSASTFVIPPDDDLIIGARAIIRGKVISVSCQLDDQSDRIFTYVRLRVREVLKGQIAEREIVLKQEGGQVGDRGSIVFGSAQFQKGERVLVYLDTWRDGSLRVYQMFLGKFSIIEDPTTGESFAVRGVADKNTIVLQNEARHDDQVATSRMEVSAYVAMVKKRLKVNRERARIFEETYYQNAPLLGEPAEYDRGRAEISPQFTFISSPPPRWFEPDSGQPVVFMVNPDGAPSPQIMEDVSAAMNAWSSVPGSSLVVTNGGASDICYAGTLNSIIFNNCDGQFAPSSGCASILALGGVGWNYGETKVVNGTTFVRAVAGHVSFNPYASCSFGNHCIVREIATHELGHALGLGHSQFSDATMFGVAHFDGRCASLRQDDMNAITFTYPSSGGGPGPLTIVSTSTLGAGTRGSTFSRQLIASGGTTPYSWSLVSGSLPAGLTLSASGIISGTPTAAGTFQFTVKVTDAQNASVQKSFSITVNEPSTGYDSRFLSQTVPATVRPNETFYVSIKWLNSGSASWNPNAGFAIVSQNPLNNVTWGGNTLAWLNAPVNPGEQMDLLFQAQAPGQAGIYNFQWQLYQQGIGVFGEASANVSITVGNPGQPLITSPSLHAAVKGTFFTLILTATGGTSPYAWQVSAGSLPDGISLNSNTGALAGTPTVAGTFSATVQVTDANAQTSQKTLTFVVSTPPVDIVTSTLPNASRGLAFSQPLIATGGKQPYTWTVTAGALPAGLSLGTIGLISGTPTAAGGFSFTVTVTDAESRTASKPLSLLVAAPPPSIAAVPALEALMGTPFSHQLNASGGAPPFIWTVTTGALPSGLSLNSVSGLLSGVPTAAGVFTLSITVRDQATLTASATVMIKVIDPETIPSIRKVKYKGARKLIVIGDRINAAAVLFVDGVQMSASVVEGQFVVKPLELALGRHEVRIVNPGGVASVPFILTVE